MAKLNFAAACLLLVMLCAGCGENRRELAPVSGRVTLKGKPIANIAVTFQPKVGADGRSNVGFGSNGITDADGKFQLKSVDGKGGALVGKHAVYIAPRDERKAEGDVLIGAPPQNPFPAESSNGSMTFDVTSGGTDHANFDF